MTAEYDISLATLNDIPGILTLQEPNLPDSGGSLSVRLTADWFKHAILEKSVVVGWRDGKGSKLARITTNCCSEYVFITYRLARQHERSLPADNLATPTNARHEIR
jgi:hypothetical protein